MRGESSSPVNLLPGRGAELLALAAISTLAACGGDSSGVVAGLGGSGRGGGLPVDDEPCSIPQEQILSGARKDGIPALTNPEMALPGQPGTGYLYEDDRVIGLIFEGEPIAVPLNIMWWHEIVNLDGATSSVAVTHCPLTGSSLAFDRRTVSGAEFGVSGLLYLNNLIMYDRRGASESLWLQMLRGARCGPSNGVKLPMVPIIETTWRGWQELNPSTKVVTENTTFDRLSCTRTAITTWSRTALSSPPSVRWTSVGLPRSASWGFPTGPGAWRFPLGSSTRWARWPS